MKKRLSTALILSMVFCAATVNAQTTLTLSLDSCRTLAMTHNKEIMASQQNMEAASQQKKAAATNYLPRITLMAGYLRNQHEWSLLSQGQKNALGGLVTQLAQAFPSMAAQISGAAAGMSGISTVDLRNIYAGALTLTQPLFMGGKISAYNRMARYNEQLARSQHDTAEQEVLMSVSEAYWTVVSLVQKQKLATSYLELLGKLESDVNKLVENGFATRADALSVAVKKNEAEMALLRVDNGVVLAKMLLCQLCGLSADTAIKTADEEKADMEVAADSQPLENGHLSGSNRPELRSLEAVVNIYKEKIKVNRAASMPQLALIGNYSVTNPNVYDGFQNKFKGSWHVGVVLTMPILDWGEGAHKTRQTKAEMRMQQYKLDDTREKIDLQVSQSTFKVNEAVKRYQTTLKNMEKAAENLRMARVGFNEGVIPVLGTMEAYTAWMQAQTDKIDAAVDVRITRLNLDKALGVLR